MDELVPLAEPLQTRLRALCDASFAEVKANQSAEQAAAAKAEMEAMDADPSLIQEFMTVMDAEFKKADADNDGILNEAESNNYLEAMDELERQSGKYAQTSAEQKAELYSITNAVNAEREGYNLDEWSCVAFNFLKMWVEKEKAAA